MTRLEHALEDLKEFQKMFPHREVFPFCIEALEKQIPKKPKIFRGSVFGKIIESKCCPECEGELCADYGFCPDCGQRVDWSEEDDK